MEKAVVEERVVVMEEAAKVVEELIYRNAGVRWNLGDIMQRIAHGGGGYETHMLKLYEAMMPSAIQIALSTRKEG